MVRHISNSEVGSWLTCRNQYRYAFDLALEPLIQSVPLQRGNMGHAVLEVYYLSRKAGITHEGSKVLALEKLSSFMSVENPPMDIIMDLRRILELYWAYYDDDSNWEILHVEHFMDLPLDDEYTMPGKLDLLVRDKTENKIVLVDHKFFYDMPGQDKLALNVQFPKYIAALANTGITVDYCVLNVLRTRKMKAPALTDLFKRFPVYPSRAKIRNALRTHILASEEIAEYRSLPEEVRPSKAIPVFNDMICKHCNFATLCASEFDGGDINYLIKTEYKPNTYGYNDTTTEGVM